MLLACLHSFIARWLNLTNVFVFVAVLALTLERLVALGARVATDYLHVGIHSAPIEMTMAVLTIIACF